MIKHVDIARTSKGGPDAGMMNPSALLRSVKRRMPIRKLAKLKLITN
jgi:hypothetical protein